MRQCRACHYHPTCAFASERQSREEGVGGNYGGSTLSQAVDLVRGSLSLLISDEISNLQTWINISPVLHLALLSKDLRILNHGVCLLGTDSCTIWSLFCEGIHEMGMHITWEMRPKLLPLPRFCQHPQILAAGQPQIIELANRILKTVHTPLVIPACVLAVSTLPTIAVWER